MSWAVGEIEDAFYARSTQYGVVFIFDRKDDRYLAASMERDEEREYSADELTPWLPAEGERVVEAGNEDSDSPSPQGVVVESGQRTSRVKWDGFFEPQTWLNTNLEPVCD